MTDALSYQDTGGGPAVLSLHGNLSRGSQWAPQPEALGDELRCIAPDQRGFGRSTGGPLPTSLLGLATTR
jgi:pimeloyl-ACP methyl ester carboxylesterase